MGPKNRSVSLKIVLHHLELTHDREKMSHDQVVIIDHYENIIPNRGE